MKPRQLWVAAYRFKRSLRRVHINGARNTINGLYPSWMEKSEYRKFLTMMRTAELCDHGKDALAVRLRDSERIKEIEGRLRWCEQTTEEDVRRHIRHILQDRYQKW